MVVLEVGAAHILVVGHHMEAVHMAAVEVVDGHILAVDLVRHRVAVVVGAHHMVVAHMVAEVVAVGHREVGLGGERHIAEEEVDHMRLAGRNLVVVEGIDLEEHHMVDSDMVAGKPSWQETTYS